MARYSIRLGCNISFDDQKETDIIEFVQSVTARHKMPELLSHLLRIACEKPEVLNYREKVPETIDVMTQLGMTPERYKFFKQVSDDVNKLKDKVDKIYDMALGVYTMAMVNKELGIEDKGKNLLVAQLTLQRQINTISTVLGLEDVGHTYHSNRLDMAQKQADEILELLIRSRSDELAELKELMEFKKELSELKVKALLEKEEGTQPETQTQPAVIDNVTIKTVNLENVVGLPELSVVQAQPSTTSTQKEPAEQKERVGVQDDKERSNVEDDVIDFGTPEGGSLFDLTDPSMQGLVAFLGDDNDDY